MKMVLILLLSVVIMSAAGFVWYKTRAADDVVRNTDAITQQFASQFKHDRFDLAGTFRWTFYLGPVKQVSTHIFAADAIDYNMRGRVHSTDYRMHKLSFDSAENKWIGQTPAGIVYVIFFTDIERDHITLYKRKCKNGLAEAMALTRPRDDATEDHGWNIYTREGKRESDDVLGFSGEFVSAQRPQQTIHISDAQIEYAGTTYSKLTHHTGERRWVGQADKIYLLLFYETPERISGPISEPSSQPTSKSVSESNAHVEKDGDTKSAMSFALMTGDDLEAMYQTKHDELTYHAFLQRHEGDVND